MLCLCRSKVHVSSLYSNCAWLWYHVHYTLRGSARTLYRIHPSKSKLGSASRKQLSRRPDRLPRSKCSSGCVWKPSSARCSFANRIVVGTMAKNLLLTSSCRWLADKGVGLYFSFPFWSLSVQSKTNERASPTPWVRQSFPTEESDFSVPKTRGQKGNEKLIPTFKDSNTFSRRKQLSKW